jgi:hypothetical protein
MQNKTGNKWLDVQIVILTMVLAISLFLWNLFAKVGSLITTGSTSQSQPVTTFSSGAGSQSSPGTILLGGNAPQDQSNPSSSVPAPFTTTGSSRP